MIKFLIGFMFGFSLTFMFIIYDLKLGHCNKYCQLAYTQYLIDRMIEDDGRGWNITVYEHVKRETKRLTQ